MWPNKVQHEVPEMDVDNFVGPCIRLRGWGNSNNLELDLRFKLNANNHLLTLQVITIKYRFPLYSIIEWLVAPVSAR